MTLDIRGSIKTTRLSLNQYVVFEELIANAIDAYLIRRADDISVTGMSVTIEVEFSPADMLEDREVMSVSRRAGGVHGRTGA